MELRAPVSGVVVPLDRVPDPVFARRMVGDGVAVDPTSREVLAPVAGVISQLHHAKHAVAVLADNGVEVLIHVGLDTVTLGGEGFTALVAQGDRVALGQPLLRFDADVVACAARSLLTEVVVTPTDRVVKLQAARGLVTAGDSVLLTLEVSAAGAVAQAQDGGEAVSSPEVAVPNSEGLHARPAAVLATEARKFPGTVLIHRGASVANAKSVVAIMGLSIRGDEKVRFTATGPGAHHLVSLLARMVEEGSGEAPGAPPAAPTEPKVRAVEPRRMAGDSRELTGAPASPGLAIGRVYQHRHVKLKVSEQGGTVAEERAHLTTALREAARQLQALKEHSSTRSKAQILEMHQALLDDPDLVDAAETTIVTGKSAAFAWQQAFTQQAAQLETLDNPLMRERAADIRDVGRRVLALLVGANTTELNVPEGSILIAEELTPSDTAAFDRSKLLGFCTTTGGSTSHLAIIARSMGIPAVCGIDEGALSIPDGVVVAIDGSHGVLRVSPDDSDASQIRARIAKQAARRDAERAAAFSVAQTADGHRVEVVANIRTAQDAREAIAAGAEGVGLLRSEFLFGERKTPPSEEEQLAAYSEVARILGPQRPLVIRTLDVGGDKPLSYLPLPPEDNPFLGLRGIRVSLEHPELFRAQLRAILRAAPAGNVHVMFPMVATLDDVRRAKELLAEEQQAIPNALKVGVMIEVPSAAVTAELLAREVDFFSIGTNDLTQYTLAMDRGHPKMARQADALHPAVLRMIAMTVEGAHEHGKWVGVCGGIASDELAVPLLVGLGIDELSVSVPTIASVKAALGRWSRGACESLATDVLRLRTATEVREFLAANVEEPEQVSAEQVLR